MKITVVGAGYVGLSMATLLSDYHDVRVVDLDVDKIAMINSGVSPLDDLLITEKLRCSESKLRGSVALSEVVEGSDFVIVATPTNYDPLTRCFDVESVRTVCEQVARLAPRSQVVIKSTIPFGFVAQLREQIDNLQVFFSPEFLREGNALYDNLNPSRVVVGSKCDKAKVFGEMLVAASNNAECPIVYLDSREAEAVKLFANGYLAMRVAYFNELDNFMLHHQLEAEGVVKAVSLDPRIGDYYNNPSFGYGGYCFPKDTKQLVANFEGVESALIGAIVKSNDVRKTTIVNHITNITQGPVGIYKVAMKEGSDNFRSAAIIDIAKGLKEKGIEVMIYDPSVSLAVLDGLPLKTDFEEFLEKTDLVVTNRVDECLRQTSARIFSRDLFGGDL